MMALTNRKSIWAKSSDGSFVFDCSLAKKQTRMQQSFL